MEHIGIDVHEWVDGRLEHRPELRLVDHDGALSRANGVARTVCTLRCGARFRATWCPDAGMGVC